jgi:maleate isomerase
MPDPQPEYGPLIGVAVPQANSTVEPEMQVLLGRHSTLLTARMTSPSPDSRQRLVDYFDHLTTHLAQFDVAPIQAAGFACTGSSYLVGPQDDADRLEVIQQRLGYPVLSAAQSILKALQTLGATRIALLSPYPAWLSDAGQAYWRGCGLTLVRSAGLSLTGPDTRNIYALQTPAVVQALDALDLAGCDAVLVSGTGMPTLRAMALRRMAVPVLSSNLCLAWALRCAVDSSINATELLGDMLKPTADWKQRFQVPE